MAEQRPSESRATRLRTLFALAVDAPTDGVDALLVAHASDDPDLLVEIKALLAAHAAASGFLTKPMAGLLGEGDLREGATQASEASQFGPYRVIETLGQGGMGVVYRAEHVATGQHVALKTVLVTTPGLLHSIRREMHTLSRMNHPGIVRIIDEGSTAGVPWYAMELVEGVPFFDYCRTLRGSQGASAAGDSARDESADLASEVARRSSVTPDDPTRVLPQARDRVQAMPSSPDRRCDADPIPDFALRDTLTVVRRLCAALTFLHGEGIVHRDLKPHNILVTADGVPVLVDFGLATQFDGRLNLEASQFSHLPEGTVSYIAPEVLAGRTSDARADLYALGCILYGVLAGRLPFTGLAQEVATGHLYRIPARLSDIAPQLPEALSDLVDRLLAKDPQQRIGYADDIGATLGRLGAADLPAEYEQRSARPYLYRPGFTGRDGLIEELSSRAQQLHRRMGGLVLLGGESGVGKTRVLLEFNRRISMQAVAAQVLMSECLPERRRPFEALRQPLQQIADRCRALGPTETARIVGDAAGFYSVVVPDFAELPGVPPSAAVEGQGREARVRLWEALTATFRALAEQQPTVLVLDDLQWADELTMSWLEYVDSTSAVAAIPLLIIGSYRTEERSAGLDRLLHSPRVIALLLDRLQPSQVASMVGDMLALAAPPPLLTAHLARHSEGNPFFVAEYLRMAIGERLLARDEAGRWSLGESAPADAASFYESLPLPQSLGALVARRLDNLAEEARVALSAACVLGRECDTDVLARVAALDSTATLRAVAELLRRQIVEESAPGRLRFMHDKIREVAYSSLAEHARRELHHTAATVLEELAMRTASGRQEELEAEAATLAFHYHRGGVADRAARYFWLAGRYARRAFALPEAETHFDTAIEILDRLPDQPALLPLRVDARLDAYPVRMHLHSAADESLVRLCREAEPLAQQLGDPARLMQLDMWYAAAYFARADYPNCMEVGLRAVERAGDDIRRLAITTYIPFVALLQGGQIRLVLERAPLIVTRMQDEGLTTQMLGQPYPPYVCLAGTLGWALAFAGRQEEADDMLAAALAAALASGHKYAIALAHAMTGWTASARGEGRRARDHGAQAVRIGRQHRLAGPEMFGLCSWGIGNVLEGKIDEGIALLEEAEAKSTTLGYAAFRTDVYYGLALGYAARGDDAVAMSWCHNGLERVAAGERKLEGEFHRLIAECALRRGLVVEADQHTRAAYAACDTLGTMIFLDRVLATRQRLQQQPPGGERGHTLP